jgi:hypothetical protein
LSITPRRVSGTRPRQRPNVGDIANPRIRAIAKKT